MICRIKNLNIDIWPLENNALKVKNDLVLLINISPLADNFHPHLIAYHPTIFVSKVCDRYKV